MKRFKINLALIAVLLGSGAAYATKAPALKFAQGEWGLYQGTYYNINSLPPGVTYNCTNSADVCTKIYEGDPNTTGTFVRNSTKTGVFSIVD